MSNGIAYVTRGGIVESAHEGVIVACDNQGRVLASVGNTELVTFARSCAKPIQAMALLESGAADATGLTDDELAVCCGSHSSEPQHVHAVESILRKAGLHESHLQCGTHVPHDPGIYEQLLQTGQPLTPKYSNCSGKHAGMLVTAHHLGYDLDTYLSVTHPVQVQIIDTLASLSGVSASDIVIGTDGCGVPTFALAMRCFARAFAQFANPTDPLHETAMRRISNAMRSHPYMVAGKNRFDTDLMVASGGRLMVKGGAEGFIAVVALDQGLSLVCKIRDGSERAIYPVVIECLKQLDILSNESLLSLEKWAHPKITNTRGDVIGEVVTNVALT